jgi:hypothetical protein
MGEKTIKQLTEELQKDPTKRAQFLNKVSSALKEMGLRDQDIASIQQGGAGDEIVVIHVEDTQRNRQTIVVGGK